MAKKEKPVYGKQYFEEFISEVEKKQKVDKTKLSTEFMSYFVYYIHPEDYDMWMDACEAVETTTHKINNVDRVVTNDKVIRQKFLEKYFPEHSETAIKARKTAEADKKKAEKAAREAEKAKLKDMTAAQRLRYKMEKIKKEEESKANSESAE